MSRVKLIVRILKSVVVGLILFIVLSYIPSQASQLVSNIAVRMNLPHQLVRLFTDVLTGFIPPELPFIGALIAILSAFGIFLEKARLGYVFKALSEALSMYYLYALLHGGNVKLALKFLEPITAEVTLLINFKTPFLIIIFLPLAVVIMREIIQFVEGPKVRHN